MRVQTRAEIARLQAKLGTTMVYVTHDQSEALAMSTRIAIFDHGEIQQIGSPTAIYETPASSFVANFVGQNNSLPGKVCKLQDGFAVVQLANGVTIRARSSRHNQVGQQTTVSIRPERLSLSVAPPADAVGLEGTIRELVYLGDQRRGRVAVPGLCDLTVTVDCRTAVATGDSVWLHWSPQDASALDRVDQPPGR
jgi:putative spermidine/putrescine transport system ATP-binding protein